MKFENFLRVNEYLIYSMETIKKRKNEIHIKRKESKKYFNPF